jgi:cell division septal protein FtsQ
MSLYQGRALRAEPPRRRGGKIRRVFAMLGLVVTIAALAHLPWSAMRDRWAVVSDVRVEGVHYLTAARVRAIAGVDRGADLFAFDAARARQRLLLDPRVRAARVGSGGLRSLVIRIEERVPVLLVEHGVPWEMDSAGVLLAPLANGVTADLPLLAGPAFAALPAGARVGSIQVRRGLAWMQALSAQELALGGQISEIDVSDPRATSLLLMNGTRVLSPAWPPATRTLSALRVVLADLAHRGTQAQEVDLRFENQVIVRPVAASTAPASQRS